MAQITLFLDPALHQRTFERARQLGLPSLEVYLVHLIARDLEQADEEQLRQRVLEWIKWRGYAGLPGPDTPAPAHWRGRSRWRREGILTASRSITTSS